MNSEIVVAIIACIGTMVSTIVSVIMTNRVTIYRIQQLESKVDKHNNVVERVALLERDNETQWKRIDEMRDDIKAIRTAVVSSK